MTNPYIGRVIDTYRLDALLGDGGMGSVYLAYDLNLDRPVALKLMHPHFARQAEFRTRLKREASAAAGLEHPSIVRIYDFDEVDELAFIVMEYVDGGNLRAHLRRLQQVSRTLPLKQSLQIGFQISEALGYAHQRQYVHRDVKPSNIILKRLSRPESPQEQPFRAILTDFGLVKLREGDKFTRSGTTLGTPIYMSPEQCEGRELDGRSDLYSLGVVLYELFTNRLPFKFKSLSEAISRHRAGTMPAPAREFDPDLPADIDAFLSRALAKEPADRFSTGEEMAGVLRQMLLGEPVEEAISERHTPTMVQPIQTTPAPASRPPAPEGFDLTIETPGHPANRVSLTRPEINIGRADDNDIVLPASGVSRRHVMLSATDTGWTVTDLGGVNGTLLNGAVLPANERIPLTPGSRLQVGPYELILSGPELATRVEPYEATPVRPRPVTPRPASSEPPPSTPPTPAPLALFLARDKLVAEPGRATDITLEVANRSEASDRVTIRVEGVPDEWLDVPEEFISVPAGASVSIPISIKAPLHHSVNPGRRRFQLILRSQQHPNIGPSVSGSLMISTFESFDASIPTELVSVPGITQVNLLNTGNANSEFTLSGHDSRNRLSLHGPASPVRLASGQQATVDVNVEANEQSWFGSGEAFPYEVEVRSRSGKAKAISGRAQIQPLIPVWMQYGGLSLILIVFFFTLFWLVFQGNRSNEARSVSLTQTAIVINATSTAIEGTRVANLATINAATRDATAVTGTPANETDPDSDGLSNQQEAIAGTDINNPDSDGDGLTDGDEVRLFGCDPTKEDTDNDFLDDFQEVDQYNTRCDKADSDDDGIDDIDEIRNGTDPRGTALPTGSPTPTSEPAATFTPTSEVSPTETPSPTITSTPELGVTPSPTSTGEPPTSTPTETPVPTTIPTETATSTPVPTLEPTFTATVATPTETVEPTATATDAPGAFQNWTHTFPLITNRQLYHLRLTDAGVISSTIEWTGSQAELTVYINSPDQEAPFAQVSGTSPLTINYTVTPDDFAASDHWWISVISFGTDSADGTTVFDYPAGNDTPLPEHDFTLTNGEATSTSVLVIEDVGMIDAQATWLGDPATMTLALYGPGLEEPYVTNSGGSGVAIVYVILPPDLLAGDVWLVSLSGIVSTDTDAAMNFIYP